MLADRRSINEVTKLERTLFFEIRKAQVVADDGASLELISFTHRESHYPPSGRTRDARCHLAATGHGPTRCAAAACGRVAYSFLGAPRVTPPHSAPLDERLTYVGSSTNCYPNSPSSGGWSVVKSSPVSVEVRFVSVLLLVGANSDRFRPR